MSDGENDFVVDQSNIKPKMVSITEKEYKQLKEDSNFLDCLRAAGVDNWEGYEEAQRMLNE